jgi:phosphoribosylanthranilate isomerase
MQVKFCGITNEEDAFCAVSFGAAALGFIFYDASPRYIEPPAARKIMLKLPHQIVRVGVFVNESAAEIKKIMKYCGLDFVQLHGDETVAFCRKLPAKKVIKAVSLKNDDDVENACAYNVAALLADSRHAGLYGGTGIIANWELAKKLCVQRPLILSGGLNLQNIRQAILQVAPAAVDVNSGVEASPGKKDPHKMARLMRILEKEKISAQREKPIFAKE